MANTKNMNIKEKSLEAEGVMDYDYLNDILFFKINNREYDYSLEFQNMLIDIDQEEFIVGIQIFNASKFLNIDKLNFKTIPKWNFKAKIDKNVIEIRLDYLITIRNKIIEKNPIIIQENTANLPSPQKVISI